MPPHLCQQLQEQLHGRLVEHNVAHVDAGGGRPGTRGITLDGCDLREGREEGGREGALGQHVDERKGAPQAPPILLPGSNAGMQRSEG